MTGEPRNRLTISKTLRLPETELTVGHLLELVAGVPSDQRVRISVDQPDRPGFGVWITLKVDDK